MSLKRTQSFKIVDTGRSRKRSRTLTVQSIPKQIRSRIPQSGFPKRVTVRLRYTDVKSYDASGAGSNFNVYRANSVLDPDLTGIGHQPLGFDEWAQIYNKYRVISCSAMAQPVPDGTTNAIPGAYALVGHNDTSDMPLSSGLSGLMENRNRGSVEISGGAANMWGQANKYQKSTYKISLAKWLGRPLNETDIGDTTSGSPVSTVFISVYITNINANNPGAVLIMTTLDYEVEFFDTKILTPS